MAKESTVRVGFRGLATAVSPMQASPGDMVAASNVVIRTKGTVTPRPGFTVSDSPGATPGTDPVLGAVEYPGTATLSYVLENATDGTLWDSGTAVLDERGDPLVWGPYAGAAARGTLFITTADATRALDGEDSPEARRAGVPTVQLLSLNNTSSYGGPAYGAGEYRAYRAVVVRGGGATEQSHVARSAPSARVVNFASGATNHLLLANLSSAGDWYLGDIIELYCTESAPSYPTDEMYLCYTHTIDSYDLADGLAPLLDATPNGELGMALYTNSSREGAEGGHLRPPAAQCITTFGGSLWLGNITYPPHLHLTWPSAGLTAGVDEIGYHEVVGTLTNGSAVATGISAGDIAHVKVGMVMYPYSVSWPGPDFVRVVSVGASSITLSQTFEGTGGSGDLGLMDSIRVGSDYWPAYLFVGAVRGGMCDPLYTYLDATGSAGYSADHTRDMYSDSYWVEVGRTVGQESADIFMNNATDTPLEVWATRGDQYDPALPEPTAGTGVLMQQDVLPDNVAWSNSLEPEHFKYVSAEAIGLDGCTVRALVCSRNSLLVFTNRGVWRASGEEASGIRFDELDTAVRILGPGCAAAVGPYVYVWAEDGVYECDENGCENISYGRISDLDAITSELVAVSGQAYAVVSNQKNHEALVCVPSAPGEPCSSIFVFNQDTRAWTKWTPQRPFSSALVGHQAPGLITLFESGNPAVLTENVTFGDDEIPITISGVSGINITISAGSGWTPAVGDSITKGGVVYDVVGFSSATLFQVHLSGLATGSAVASVASPCVVTPVVCDKTAPFSRKIWGEGSLVWLSRVGLKAYVLGFTTDTRNDPDEILVSKTLTDTPGAENSRIPVATRFLVPRGAARSGYLQVSITVSQPRAQWALSALSITCRRVSERARSVLG